MRQAQAPSRRGSSADDIDSWMARRWAHLERRDIETIGGREATNRGRDGRRATSEAVRGADDRRRGVSTHLVSDNPQDSDVLTSVDPVELGAEPDGGAPQLMDLGLKFRAARSGDSISRLLGSSDPGAIGKFLSLNGMDGRNSTLREGRSYVVPTRWDDATDREARAGQALLGFDNARLRALAQAREAEAREAELLRQSPNASPVDPMTMGSQPLTSAPARRTTWFDEHPALRALARHAGWTYGMGPGVVRGGFNTVKGGLEGAHFVSRLANPLDALLSRPGDSAAQQLGDAVLRGGSYVKRGVEDPSIVRDDIRAGVHAFRRKHDLSATPQAKTLLGEYWRAAGVGMNNGELVADAGSTFVGGTFLRSAAGLRKLAGAPTAKELAFMADNPGFAARLKEAYWGMGHHIVGRNQKLPAWLGGGRYPEWFLESEFNKIAQDGMTTRDVYRNHVGVDDDYYGGKVGKKYGGTRWSAARDLGWTRYGPVDRLDYGTSPSTKAVVGPILLGGPAAGGRDEEAGR